MAFTSLSVDIYLPAMPMMSVSLYGNIELTITGFLIAIIPTSTAIIASAQANVGRLIKNLDMSHDSPAAPYRSFQPG
ncbi:hypothetical protein HH682_11755 [Rosenbergiella sp. S61]|uniref:Uncharacterized protein n=1 Tax=Rosenbergiella gaditana TaxID=2726987 RepID=A0ABS5SY95_9GAMM|nr:hypothetical protein [Rosenbergiella gaditana]